MQAQEYGYIQEFKNFEKKEDKKQSFHHQLPKVICTKSKIFSRKIKISTEKDE